MTRDHIVKEYKMLFMYFPSEENFLTLFTWILLTVDFAIKNAMINFYCVKSVRIWSFSDPYSVRMRENTDEKKFRIEAHCFFMS